MNTCLPYIIIAFLHWVADFVCQTNWQAQNKSKSWDALSEHVGCYTAIWLFPILILTGFQAGKDYWDITFIDKRWLFVPVTFGCHLVTDYFTSRVNSRLFGKDWHNFFVSVGFDQFLHYTQLFLTYWYLFT